MKNLILALAFLGLSTAAHAEETHCTAVSIVDPTREDGENPYADVTFYWKGAFPTDGKFVRGLGGGATFHLARHDELESTLAQLNVEILKSVPFESEDVQRLVGRITRSVSTKKLRITSLEYRIGRRVVDEDIMRPTYEVIENVICRTSVYHDLRPSQKGN